ncbi:sodium:solute symporter family protein, partial [Halobacterium salinarum]|nr:sodium:solute symporter family protein [Halobacterium salinarum]
ARREDTLGRVGVAAFAVAAFGGSLLRPGSLLEVGSTAFGGFAQLAPPVALAMYWRRTTKAGMFAGVLGTQAFYLATVFGPPVTLAGVPIIASSYFGWFAQVVGLPLGVVLTVGVSAVTAPSATENASAYVDALRAD